MDVGNIGINIGVVGAIIAVSKLISSIDKEKKFKRFYTLLPFIFGVVGAACVTNPFTVGGFITNAFTYASVSAYIYKFGKTTILNK